MSVLCEADVRGPINPITCMYFRIVVFSNFMKNDVDSLMEQR